MDWRHEVSPLWLQARKEVLTATELASCVAAWKRITKAQKAGDDLFPAFCQLWAKKQSTSEPETWSKGTAARGHILEPYAIDDWNKQSDIQFYHWDDTIIARNGLGWSPDGLDRPQETARPIVTQIEDKLCDQDHPFREELPTALIEIKSYEPNKHMKCMITDKSKLDERWQVACGLWTVPNIDKAIILFYSIDTNLSFFVEYTREDLEAELEQIEDMVALWNKNKAKLSMSKPKFQRTHTEKEVYQEYIAEMTDILKI